MTHDKPDDWNQAQAVHRLPTEPYLGLSIAEARAHADGEGRSLRDCTGVELVTADFRPRRLRVWLDDEGKVERATAG